MANSVADTDTPGRRTEGKEHAADVRPPGDGGDACPGALRLHLADDGPLARVRVPGGVLTTAQMEALAHAAHHLGDGELHLTSRGNVQLRALRTETCGADLAAALHTAGLLPSATHERVRNIVASPLSGLDGQGHRDLAPWLHALDTLLCASAPAVHLSGRFLFALDDGRGDMASLEPDITLVAGPQSTATVRIGATATLTVLAEDAPRIAVHAAEAFVAAARSAGTDRVWRLADLPGGPEAVRALAREVTQRPDITATLTDSATVTHTDPADATATATATATDIKFRAAPAPGAFPGGVSVGVPLGRFTPAQWTAVRHVAARTGLGVRLTPWRGAVLPGATSADLVALAATGLVTEPGSPWTGVTACIGRPGCAKSLADVRSDARTAVHRTHVPAQHPADGQAEPPVHWSGCARRCGRPRGDRVDVVAVVGGYEVTAVRAGKAGRTTSVTGTSSLAATVAAARTGT
ncbi:MULTISPECIES: cobalamin biosynthesis protein CobG [unclassified Streptomyces]|uniref:cobalamin biosynthesis protein CobG n=1 Tax=unclassified Streptomyces TaxID=2593676 RepID=UPI001F4ECB7F|nr:cobalamin biosynthesis protein CobG [Streptomyces sp. AmelKG-E11A]